MVLFEKILTFYYLISSINNTYNKLKLGQPDPRTVHIACPIIEKNIAKFGVNIWITDVNLQNVLLDCRKTSPLAKKYLKGSNELILNRLNNQFEERNIVEMTTNQKRKRENNNEDSLVENGDEKEEKEDEEKEEEKVNEVKEQSINNIKKIKNKNKGKILQKNEENTIFLKKQSKMKKSKTKRN